MLRGGACRGGLGAPLSAVEDLALVVMLPGLVSHGRLLPQQATCTCIRALQAGYPTASGGQRA